jgi:hypothetical protein
MFSPFSDDLSALSDNDLHEKIQSLSKKYITAQRLGKNEMLTQIQTFITIYKQELTVRAAKNKQDDNDDLNNLINVE